MLTVTTALAAAGVALSAAGAYSQAKAQKQQTEFLEDQASQNAEVAKENELAIDMAGRTAVYHQRRATASALGSVRAGVAGAGLRGGYPYRLWC